MAQKSEEVVTWGQIFTRTYFPSLLLACLGVWLHAADSLLTATMMPSIVRDIGGTALIAWTVALYQLGSIAAGAASGLLSLRYGSRVPMLAAALTFAFGCIVSAIAPSMEVVLVGRLFQGIGGGGLVAMTFVSVNSSFPELLVGRVIGVISAVWGTSAFFGPMVGGLFVEYANWRYGFWFFAAQALLLSTWLFLRKADTPTLDNVHSKSRFPIARIFVLSLAVLCVAFAGVKVSFFNTSLFVIAGMSLFYYFVKIDSRRTDNRLLPINPFNLFTPVGAGLLMILLFSAATIPIGVYVPFFITNINGTSELVSGYIIALESIFWSVAAVSTAGMPANKDKMIISIGMTLIFISCLSLVFTVAFGPLWTIAISAILQGAGFGMAWAFILRRAVRFALKDEENRVVSALPTVQMLGYALGAAYIGIIANSAGIEQAIGSELKSVSVVTFLGAVPICFVGLVAMVKFVKFVED